MTEGALLLATVGVPAVTAALVWLAPSARAADRLCLGAATATAVLGLGLAAVVLLQAPAVAGRGSWYVLDPLAGIFVALVATVGAASAAVSPSYLRHSGRGWFSARRSHTWYYSAFFVFWAALLALPTVDNLAVAWLLIEATTAASALLVGFSGARSALEAGWKYLVLTTLGLSIALLGVILLFAALSADGGGGLGSLDWESMGGAAGALPEEPVVVAFALILVGLASKIGWAPVHNWLPDAHSEAPAPVSAMLSAALLPTVLAIAWRTQLALAPALDGAGEQLFIGFGLVSLAIAVPFLWRPLPWKRLLAYSSLEHMGVLALGIGIGTPLAIAGVVLHVAGHGVAKALGFYAAIPLLRHDPGAARRPARGVARANAPTAAAMAVSLLALAGLPPSPLFVSELMMLLGGVEAGMVAVVAIATVLLALGFIGLAQALLGGLTGRPRAAMRGRAGDRSARRVAALAAACGAVLAGLTVAAYALPESGIVEALLGGGG